MEENWYRRERARLNYGSVERLANVFGPYDDLTVEFAHCVRRYEKGGSKEILTEELDSLLNRKISSYAHRKSYSVLASRHVH